MTGTVPEQLSSQSKRMRRKAALSVAEEMRQTEHLLDLLAREQDTVISNLRLVPHYRQNTIHRLYRMPDKESVSLLEWRETLSYLTETHLAISSYEDVESLLNDLYDSSTS